MMDTCSVHYNLNYGLVAQYLGGKYTAKWIYVDMIIEAVYGHVSDVDMEHMIQI